MNIGTNKYNDFFNATSKEEAEKALKELIESEMTNLNIQNNVIDNKKYMSTDVKKYYESVANMLKAKQAVAPDNVVMPSTEVDLVTENMLEQSKVMNGVKTIAGKYLTQVVMNNKAVQQGAWGEITAEIVQECLQGFKVLDIVQHKVSAFGKIPMGMLDLGPQFLGNHMRTTMVEALVGTIEAAIVNGDGKGKPVGLTRDLGGSVVDGVYPLKEKIAVTDFGPTTYFGLVEKISKDQNGRAKKFDKVQLLMNQKTYLQKVAPAVTFLGEVGYKEQVVPFPTEFIVTEALADNEAVMAILPDYLLALGKGPEVTYSDQYKWLEDERVYKIKAYCDGRPKENTTALFLDVTNLVPVVKKVTVV